MTDIDEIVVHAVRRTWRAIFTGPRTLTRPIDGETLGTETPQQAAAMLRRRGELGPEWRLQLVELRHTTEIELRAAVPDHRIEGDDLMAEVWIGGDCRGKIVGLPGGVWHASLAPGIDGRSPFTEGFYATRSYAAAAVAAGLLNGRDRAAPS
ncbi:MAG: hypothetical protein DHS20C19_22290 [Acidimicrobiales bacterium]|nr:MAG: hypothetical protein DHS20C19_22290 [Acidimicrobiales bacterium]